MLDSFDDIQCEEDPQYLAYQASLEIQQYLDSEEFLAELNAELAEIAEEEREQRAVDFVL